MTDAFTAKPFLTIIGDMIAVDQYGWRVWAHSRESMVREADGGRISKMYRDKGDGRTVHVGYVVGPHWFEAFQPVELPA